MPGQSDGDREDPRRQRDRDKSGERGERVGRDQETAGAIAGSNGPKREGNAEEDRERRDER